MRYTPTTSSYDDNARGISEPHDLDVNARGAAGKAIGNTGAASAGLRGQVAAARYACATCAPAELGRRSIAAHTTTDARGMRQGPVDRARADKLREIAPFVRSTPSGGMRLREDARRHSILSGRACFARRPRTYPFVTSSNPSGTVASARARPTARLSARSSRRTPPASARGRSKRARRRRRKRLGERDTSRNRYRRQRRCAV